MKPDDLRHLASDPKFIPGIYNYCDRWCERCPLSHRCLNYAMEQEEDKSDPAARDLSNQKFWDKLHRTLQGAAQMIQENDQLEGLDLDDPETEAEMEREMERRTARHRAAREHPLAKAAMDYGLAVQEWMESNAALFKSKGVELRRKARLDIGRPLEEAEEITDLIEVIEWYHWLIHVKFSRALSFQAFVEEEVDRALRSVLNDGDGSAKIALIGVDRSLAAWTGLRPHFEESDDAILDFQVRLARLRSQAEKIFPQARAFLRPGFDEQAG